MPNILAIRLLPGRPVSSAVFKTHVTEVTIKAFRVSMDDPEGRDLTSKFALDAKYVAPNIVPAIPDPNPILVHPDPSVRIVQHFGTTLVDPLDPLGDKRIVFFSVGTAVFEIPVADEFDTLDVRLEVTGKYEVPDGSGGTETVEWKQEQILFNVVEETTGSVADPNTYPTFTTGAYIKFPSPEEAKRGRSLQTPPNGIARNFTDVKNKIEPVLIAEEGNPNRIADLGPEDCYHVAHEIVSNRTLFPIPQPSDSLITLYTDSNSNGRGGNEAARGQFEGELGSFYAKRDGESRILAAEVFAVSTALWCHAQTSAAMVAGFEFPITAPSPLPSDGFINDGKVILYESLDGAGQPNAALNPSFEVDAQFFYALGNKLPMEVDREARLSAAGNSPIKMIESKLKAAAAHGEISAVTGTPIQAARRIKAITSASETGTPLCKLDGDVETLVQDWLGSTDPEIADSVWTTPAANAKGHLDLVLCLVAGGHTDLITEIKGVPVTDVTGLKNLTNEEWTTLLKGPPARLPDFTKPGSVDERVAAFLRRLKKFWGVTGQPQTRGEVKVTEAPTLLSPEQIGEVDQEPRQDCIDKVRALVTDLDVTEELRFSIVEALWARGTNTWERVRRFGSKDLFKKALRGSVAFSFADGIWDAAKAIWEADGLSAEVPGGEEDFVPVNDGSLINCIPPDHLSPLGPVAYLSEIAKVSETSQCENPFPGSGTTIQGQLDNRRGDLNKLEVSAANVEFAVPQIDLVNESLEHIAQHMPEDPTGHVAKSKFYNTPQRHILNHWIGDHDANRLLEAIPVHSTPTIHKGNKTAYEKLENEFVGCHLPYSQRLDVSRSYLNAMGTSRYEVMRHFRKTVTEFVLAPEAAVEEFQGHLWRYPVDIDTAIEYLGISSQEHQLFTGELELDDDCEYQPGENALSWKIRLDHFLECSCLNYCEFLELVASGFAMISRRSGEKNAGVDDPEAETDDLTEVSGLGDKSQTALIAQGITTYAELAELTLDQLTDAVADVRIPNFKPEEWLTQAAELAARKAADEPQTAEDADGDNGDAEVEPEDKHRFDPLNGFDPCEPCCLADVLVAFSIDDDPAVDDAEQVASAKKRLKLFVWLWRKFRDLRNIFELPFPQYSFNDLSDICLVLESVTGAIPNDDFVRQFAALQMFRDDYRLPILDSAETAGRPAGADRSTLLAFWVNGHARFDWAVGQLLDSIQDLSIQCCDCGCAKGCHKCCRKPEFLKLLADKDVLDRIATVAGLADVNGGRVWDTKPTYTLRFAEILTKIYRSNFSVAELLFLFTNGENLRGTDPFPLQPDNEAMDRPFGSPDDQETGSLRDLRQAVCGVCVSDEDAKTWTWQKISSTLRDEFGLEGQAKDDWDSFGQHFFPAESGASESRYSEPLIKIDTTPRMWDMPSEGPFLYDAEAVNINDPDDGDTKGQLHVSLPLSDKDVLDRLNRLRQLEPLEVEAVRNLYFKPRIDLARFAFLFSSFNCADKVLIQGLGDEGENRFAWFQRQFAIFHAKCHAIADHLAEHIHHVTDSECNEGAQRAMLLLKHLWADENWALADDGTFVSWEDDDGTPPHGPQPDGREGAMTWGPRPFGGAFAALLGVCGNGLLGEYQVQRAVNEDGCDWTDKLVWRDLTDDTAFFDPCAKDGGPRNHANSPMPTILPWLDGDKVSLSDEVQKLVSLRNGMGTANHDTSIYLGGMEPFQVTWTGQLLVETTGEYRFAAGSPTTCGEMPDFESAADWHFWRVEISQGNRKWVQLSHESDDEDAPEHCTTPVRLTHGFYDIKIELTQRPVAWNGEEDVCAMQTGFQVKYNGPDSCDEWAVMPKDKLFQPKKEATLASGLNESLPDHSQLSGGCLEYLQTRYYSTVRDVRRTYQRAFKALLFVHQMDLSTEIESDSLTSELEHLLANPERFLGRAYYEEAGDGFDYQKHDAWFDPNFLPVGDNYHKPEDAVDARVQPSLSRQQAMFDWWERLYDYTAMRADTVSAPKSHVWLLFHESDEGHPDVDRQLADYIGIDEDHGQTVRLFYVSTDPAGIITHKELGSADLTDDRWAVRAWHAANWISELGCAFTDFDLESYTIPVWASDGPATEANNKLMEFFRNGSIENGLPLKYQEIKRLNDGLRVRGRDALVAYLIVRNRIKRKAPATRTKDEFISSVEGLSEYLLQDVGTQLCQQTTRIEEAISVAQNYVQRNRLGLESGGFLAPFRKMWDSQFASFNVWKTCKSRTVYSENWVGYDEIKRAGESEAFQHLQSELRRNTLTAAQPGGLVAPNGWSGQTPPAFSPAGLLQEREPSTIGLLTHTEEREGGLNLLGISDRQARPSWLASFEKTEVGAAGEDGAFIEASHITQDDNFPMWIQSAVRLGAKFIRVAAAAIPNASTKSDASCEKETENCCTRCDDEYSALMDEYYFWIEDTSTYRKVPQNADWGVTDDDATSDWHRDERLPTLLHWNSDPAVHLRWCRVHNGEFQNPRQSSESVRISSEGEGEDATNSAELIFLGRENDSLYFKIKHTAKDDSPPAGFGANSALEPDAEGVATETGFRYDIATDEAIIVPNLPFFDRPDEDDDGEDGDETNSSAFPFFAWHTPGAPLYPPSTLAMALSVAKFLRSHCQFEQALKWYELAYAPLKRDNRWIWREAADGESQCVCPSGSLDEPTPENESQNRLVVIEYVANLMDWADALIARNSPESVQQARLVLDTATRILGEAPTTVHHDQRPDTRHRNQCDGSVIEEKITSATTLDSFEAECAPLNSKLLSLYVSASDRLSIVHGCLSAQRQRNGNGIPFSISELSSVEGDLSCCDDEWCVGQSPYRFQVLLQKANEIAGDVRALGSGLLSAFEKGDAEYLSAMRATHERQIFNLTLDIRKNQWRESDWQVQALQKTKEMAQTRLRYYKDLIQVGLIANEKKYQQETELSLQANLAGQLLDYLAQTQSSTPNQWLVAFAGTLSGTGTITQLPMGSGGAIAQFASIGARISNAVSAYYNIQASLSLTEAGWDRREDEWRHQVDVITIEIEQIQRQILAAERRRDIALRELNNQQQQMDNSAEVHDFLRDKFTNHALYLWLQQETAALYYQSYELAMQCARQAQRAFNFERGHTARKFIECDNWDNLHEGLLAGERLQLSLRQMEKAYYDENEREYELTKSFSLKHHFPEAFFQLVQCGECEIEIPEWLFDLDYPGHYMRRIKNVTLTLPCVVGSHQGVHCRLTLLSSTTRVSPQISEPARGCCDSEANGYSYLPDDPRVVNQYAATDAIATSSGQNDSGMFELRFNDERYLPFEYHGAVSRWRIELPQENNHFDTTTLSDAILQMNFMAREGGERLRVAAKHAAKDKTPNDGVLLLDVKREFPDAWHRFTHGCEANLELELSPSLLPYSFRSKELEVSVLELFAESEAKSLKWNVEFASGQTCAIKKGQGGCDQQVLNCVPAIEQCDFLYGVLAEQSWQVDAEANSAQRLLLSLQKGINNDCDKKKQAKCCKQVYLLLRYKVNKESIEGMGPKKCC